MMQTVKLQLAVYSKPPCKQEKILNSYKTNFEIDDIYTRLSEFALIYKNGQGFWDEHVRPPTIRNNYVKGLKILQLIVYHSTSQDTTYGSSVSTHVTLPLHCFPL